MTLKEFQSWYQGFIDGAGEEFLRKDQWAKLREMISRIDQPELTFKPGGTTNPWDTALLNTSPPWANMTPQTMGFTTDGSLGGR